MQSACRDQNRAREHRAQPASLRVQGVAGQGSRSHEETQYFPAHPADILVALNIKLYEERPKHPAARERAPRISHEMYYWNIAVLAQSAGAREVGELVGTLAVI